LKTCFSSRIFQSPVAPRTEVNQRGCPAGHGIVDISFLDLGRALGVDIEERAGTAEGLFSVIFSFDPINSDQVEYLIQEYFFSGVKRDEQGR